MKVRDFMVTPVVTVHAECTLEQAARTMLDKDIGALPIVDERGDLLGIVTESDFGAKEKGIPFSLYRYPQLFGQWMPKQGVEKLYQSARKMSVGEIMRREVVTVTEDDSLELVLQKMLDNDFHRLPVVRGKKPVGMVSRHDLLRLMLASIPRALGQ
jgi:CBS domain-containing protein